MRRFPCLGFGTKVRSGSASARLASRERRILFEYDPAFVASGIEISPFELPLKTGVIESRQDLFDGLFGVFADSLPDGWGRLLIDRAVEKRGSMRGRLGPLDRLAFVGRNGMGALSYEPDYSGELTGEGLADTKTGKEKGRSAGRRNKNDTDEAISLDRIAEESRIVLTGDSEEVFDELLGLNGSSGGARPKIVVQVSEDRKRIIHGRCPLEMGYEHWMIKFASSQDERDAGAIEYAYRRWQQAWTCHPRISFVRGGADISGCADLTAWATAAFTCIVLRG